MRIKKISFLLILLFSFSLFAASSKNKNIFDTSKFNISKKGFLNGPVKTYYKNGKLKSKEYYVNNRKSGIWQYYHENGKLKSEVIFNVLSQDEEAVVKTYDEKGIIISSGKVVNSEMVGVWTYYDEMGRKLNSYDLTKGIVTTYSEKGKVILQVSERDLLNRLEEIMVEVKNDRTRANEEKN
ncbi:MAG: toxin-antitoxin system YwqK family antitoxin [Fusobacterium sp.]|uniref:toxin-antitoxin system YwqK family antitoxin n=1 Tax=unclassified Fusobacterium TaxID=2648384 RepID=UPI0003013439|nr:MORN repeat protein [Fusobacterium sp. oral taxon 370]